MTAQPGTAHPCSEGSDVPVMLASRLLLMLNTPAMSHEIAKAMSYGCIDVMSESSQVTAAGRQTDGLALLLLSTA